MPAASLTKLSPDMDTLLDDIAWVVVAGIEPLD